MNYAIETDALSYSFSKNQPLLKNINLKVPKGSIYGLLGQNGAGKTTTIMLILGLLKQQHGSIHIEGKSLKKERIQILENIGSLVGSPSFYGHLSARDNLVILQKIYRCPESRINEILRTVGLHETGKKKVEKFSLGMKQRLSIAMALLHEPTLLILDEPTNGLDPKGIIEIRELLLHINKSQGVTILISSHQLSELEKLVSHLAIIHTGEVLYQGTYDELKLKQKELAKIHIETNDNLRAKELLHSKSITSEELDGKLVFSHIPNDAVSNVISDLITGGVKVYQVTRVESDLESTFINLTNHN